MDKITVNLGTLASLGVLEWLIALAGVSVTAGVWIWFLSGRTHARPRNSEQAQEARVRVKGRYMPDRVFVEAGRPVRLTFFREETAPCSEGVVFPDYGRHVSLPAYRDVVIELPPSEPGEHEFTCQMGMLRGSLIVVGKDEAIRHSENRTVAVHQSGGSAL